jgi:hypothetical protein
MSAAGPSQGASAPSGGSAVRAATSVGAIAAAGPCLGAKRDDAARVRLFGPSAPAQAGAEPRASAPSGGSAAHAVASLRATE